MNSEVVINVFCISMIILNIVGTVWLGITFGHFILVPAAYIVILVIIGNININACIITAIIVAVITLIAIVINIVIAISDASVYKKRHKEEKIKQEEQLKKNNNLLDAVKSGDKETTQKLIEDGADVNCEDFDERTPLDLAKNNEIIAILKKHGAKTKSELEAEEAAELKRQEQEEIKQSRLNNKLIAAIHSHDIQMAESLISQGADVDFVFPPSVVGGAETSPLIMAVIENDIEMVKLLVINGAKIFKKIRLGIYQGPIAGRHYPGEDLGSTDALEFAKDKKDINIDIICFLEYGHRRYTKR